MRRITPALGLPTFFDPVDVMIRLRVRIRSGWARAMVWLMKPPIDTPTRW